MPRPKSLDVDLARVLSRLPATYPHIGVYDVRHRKAFAARNTPDQPAIASEHASLFVQSDKKPLVVKDRFLCFWFYPPHTRVGLVQGYPIDWSEHNLLVRLDPRWSYVRQILLPAHQIAAIETNTAQQINFAAHLLQLYRAHGLHEALSVHLIGPRATDSLFYAHRWEPKY